MIEKLKANHSQNDYHHHSNVKIEDNKKKQIRLDNNFCDEVNERTIK